MDNSQNKYITRCLDMSLVHHMHGVDSIESPRSDLNMTGRGSRN